MTSREKLAVWAQHSAAEAFEKAQNAYCAEDRVYYMDLAFSYSWVSRYWLFGEEMPHTL